MKELINIVENLLKCNKKYISEEGEILRDEVYEDAYNTNEVLLKILLGNSQTKNEFFKYVDDICVFDSQKFISFINLKEFLEDSYTKYSNKIGLTTNNKFISQINDVVLDFPYKDCILKGGQENEKEQRSENFYNETVSSEHISRMLSPKVLTNVKKYTKDGFVEIDEFNGENLIIKGNNLFALSTLTKKYAGRVKCIYIDPPYNTGKSFKYNDSFNHSSWLTFMKNRLDIAYKLLSDDGVIFVNLDDKESHYCKVLMDSIFGRESFVREIVWLKGNAQNDVIGIQKNTESILVYTKTPDVGIYKERTLDKVEIFEEDGRYFYKGSGITTGGEGGILNARPNLGATLYYNPKTGDLIPKVDYNRELARISNDEKTIYDDDEELISKGYVIIRAPRKGDKLGCWTWSYDKLNDEKDSLLISYSRKKYSVKKKEYIDDIEEKNIIKKGKKLYYNIEKYNALKNFIKISSSKGTKELKGIFNKKVFENPKNEELIKKLIDISTKEGDIVMDFFLGTGTTCATAHKMNRKYIGVEQMDYIEDITINRLKSVVDGDDGGISSEVEWTGGGSFVYCELKENSNMLISKINGATEEEINDIKNVVFKHDRLLPYIMTNELIQENKEFDSLTLDEKKVVLIKLIDKNTLYVNFSDIDDSTYNVSEKDKIYNKKFYE